MSICIQYSSPQYRMMHAARIHVLVARSVPWHSCTTPSTNRWNHRQVWPNFPDAESMWPLEGTWTWKTWWHRLIQVWKHFSLSPLRVSIAWSLCRFQWWTECWADAWALRTCWTNIERCWQSEWEFWGHTTTAKRFYCRSHFRGFAACTWCSKMILMHPFVFRKSFAPTDWMTDCLIEWLIAGRRRLCAMLLFYCGGWQMLFIVHLSIYFKSSSSSRRARLEHLILYIYICLFYVWDHVTICYCMAVYDFLLYSVFRPLHKHPINIPADCFPRV